MEQNIRTFKDFLQFYNLMSETCFRDCINTFGRRELETDEINCVERCATKLIRFNNRSIAIYAKVQEKLMTQRVEEMEKQQQVAETNQQEQQNNQEVAVEALAAPTETTTESN